MYTLAEREPVPLSLLHLPLCVTFSFYPPVIAGGSGALAKSAGEAGGEAPEMVTLLDATVLEEQIREGSMTISMNRHGEICQIAKLGGVPVDAVSLLGCVSVAAVKVKELSSVIGRRIVEDAKKRDKGGLAAELSAENDRVS